MRRILSTAEMKNADANTFKLGLPSMVLMERAALGVVDVIFDHELDPSRTLILAGPGNNGGDGAAVARILYEKGYEPEIKVFGSEEKYTDEMRTQIRILKNIGVAFNDSPDPEDYTLIIDCLFGIGLKRDITGEIADMIDAVNESSTPVISVDIPSGINGDTGYVCGTAIIADITVGVSDPKPGYLLGSGKSHCGELIVKDIGIVPCDDDTESSMFMIDDEDFFMLPPRDENGNKGTFGKLLVIAGSENICGAAYLSAAAALKTGIGMVKVFTHENNRTAINTLLPEALVTTYKGADSDLLKLDDDLKWADAVLIGPGLSTDEFAVKIFDRFITSNNLPAVIDADALNIISASDRYNDTELDFQAVITPHVGEMSRLSGKTVQEIKGDPVSAALEFAENGFICVLKDAVTVTAYPGNTVFINTSGCSALSTAGSGDVLAGMIAGYILRYKDSCLPLSAMAVYSHGKKGEKAAEEKGADAVTASDLI